MYFILVRIFREFFSVSSLYFKFWLPFSKNYNNCSTYTMRFMLVFNSSKKQNR